MSWKNVIKQIIIASSPILLPVMFVGVVIKFFGLTLDSLMIILILGQLYIVWAQLEVALRQTHLYMLEREPELKIEVKKRLLGDTPCYDIWLTNVGKYTVKNAFISINNKENKEKLKSLISLLPDETIHLHSINKENFSGNIITIDITYENMLGNFSRRIFMKDPTRPVFVEVENIRMPGILLNSLENLISILRALPFLWRISRIKNTESIKPARSK